MDSQVGSPSSFRGSDEDADSSSRPHSPFALDHPRPDLPPSLPALVLRKLVAHQLDQAGFDAADEDATQELEGALHEFFGSLLSYAHQLAELGRRHQPNLMDVVHGCRDLGVGGAAELLDEAAKQHQATDIAVTYKRPRAPSPPPLMLHSDDEALPEDDPSIASPPPSPAFLPSDDDEDADFEEVLPLGPDGQPLVSAVAEREARKKAKEQRKETRRKEKEDRQKERERRRRERQKRKEADPFRAGWLPVLPPKHSWKQTPVYPQSAAPPPIPPPISQTQQAPSSAALQHLSTLRARLNDSQLVAASLRNLIRRTGARNLSSSTSGAALTELGPDGQPTEQSQPQQAEQDADVVDYESEWYGAKEAFAAPAGKRRIRVLTVGADKDDDEDYGQQGSENQEGSRVGGAAKRRRWLV
ncbi:hypothetical protein JCM11641_005024 [Rhodosporidiobolus odoratus]